MRSLKLALAASGCLAVLATSPVQAQSRPARSGSDPRVDCIRETEKTYPPQSISRKVRDRYVEDCMAKRGGAR